MSDDRQERRKSHLTDHDLERIGDAFDERLSKRFELIGYDDTTPESRAEIRKDHEWTRTTRQFKTAIIMAIALAIAGGIGTTIYNGMTVAAQEQPRK